MAITISGSGITSANIADGTITTDDILASDVSSLKSGRKNLIINGAMQVAQRGTSATGLSSDANTGYKSVDRMKFMFSGTVGTVWSQEQSTDSPPNFQYSLKTTATTGSVIAADNLDRLEYLIDSTEISQLGYGTTTPKTSTLSFWTKANKTGNFTASIYNQNSTRFFTSSVTINTADTWEYKTITIPGDTVALTGTSAIGFRIFITYGAGPDKASGTRSLDTWGTSLDTTMLYKNGTLDIGSTTNDYFSITGIQLEVGSVATDFEHRSYSEELALCLRYYEISPTAYLSSYGGDSVANIAYKVEKRVTPTSTVTDASASGITAGTSDSKGNYLYRSGTTGTSARLVADAEL
jgi:hypothetical protein